MQKNGKLIMNPNNMKQIMKNFHRAISIIVISVMMVVAITALLLVVQGE